MTASTTPIRVAVVGAGIAGAACAAGLRLAGAQVTVFDRSAAVGGRMATTRRRLQAGAAGEEQAFDHGAQCFTAVRPRFRASMARAVARGCAAEWRPIVHASRPLEAERCFVGIPSMPAICSHLLAGATVKLESTVRRLQRTADGLWHVAIDTAPLSGPYELVVLALPPAQAAVLVAGHHDAWAAVLMARRMEACWTLIAVTDDVEWPWDAAEPDVGPLAWVARNDRVPGRQMQPGMAVWTAHATALWSADHLDAEPLTVKDELRKALAALMPAAIGAVPSVRWHYADVHRWRYAGPDFACGDGFDAADAWWNPSLGLGVCGDWLGGGGVEAAWHSGDELADHIAASLEQADATAELAGAAP